MQLVPFALKSRLVAGDGFVELELQNGSGQRVSNLVAIWNGYPVDLGTLVDGGSTEVVLQSGVESDFQSIDWTQYVSGDELAENRARLVGDLARQQRFQERVNEIMVIGWTESPLLPVAVEPAFDRAIDLHIVVVRHPIERSGG